MYEFVFCAGPNRDAIRCRGSLGLPIMGFPVGDGKCDGEASMRDDVPTWLWVSAFDGELRMGVGKRLFAYSCSQSRMKSSLNYQFDILGLNLALRNIGSMRVSLQQA